VGGGKWPRQRVKGGHLSNTVKKSEKKTGKTLTLEVRNRAGRSATAHNGCGDLPTRAGGAMAKNEKVARIKKGNRRKH